MDIFKGLEDIIETDAPLGRLTTLGVGGPCRYLARPRSEDQLRDVLARCEKHGLPSRVMGRGSNLLVRDEGVPGVVIQIAARGFGDTDVEEDLLRVGAGVPLPKVVQEAARHGLSGVECLVGIPGTVGGAVRMNAGGAFGDIGQTVERVKVMDTRGQAYFREREDLVFGYRTSNIAARFILGADLRLQADSEKAILARVRKIWIARRNTQPTGAPSAGCVFKNPRGLSAGALIDQAGLKGKAVGGAMVSRKHANYIVVKDRDKATAADVLALIDEVRKVVKERFDVDLELEINVWP
jgi:UDP-N-acetylmuramate dehydrogenase